MLAGLPAFAFGEAIHGPIVLWHTNPQNSARIVWIEETGRGRGVEGQWSVGRGGFGYGDDDDQTVFPGMKDGYLSLAIRRAVELPPKLGREARLVLEVNYDDGFVAWLDGREVARRHVEGRGEEMKATARHEAGAWEAIPLGTVGDLIRTKAPVLALQGFNRGLDSSDFSLDARLVAVRGQQRVEVIPQRSLWEYLAEDRPDPLWFARVTRRTPVVKESSVPVRKLPFGEPGKDAGQFAWADSWEFADTGARVYSAKLSALRPATEYEFVIGGLRQPAAVPYRFRTAPEQPDKLCFVTGGDMFHRRELLDPMNRRAGLESPAFALLGGDLAYANGVKGPRWFEWLDSWAENARTPDGLLVPMVVAIGNHEVKGVGYRPDDPPERAQAKYFYPLFVDPDEPFQAQRTVDFGSWLSLVLLDSGHTQTVESQVPFLRRALDERREVGRLFVCYHRPAWGTGVKDDAEHIQRLWSPLFEEFQVDAVFENDHHVLKRSHPIRAGKVDEENGVPYLGDGSWGVDVRKIPAGKLNERPWIATAKSLNHLWRIDLDEGGWTGAALDSEGKKLDEVRRKWRR